jgi:hypothetical protein
MHTTTATRGIVGLSPRLKARMAGALYLLAVLAAAFAELSAPTSLSVTAGLFAVACYIAVTVLMYEVLKPANEGLASLAASLNFVGGGFEVLRWNPWGVDVAIVFHGLYCLLIAYLVYRSGFLPRALYTLMAFAGLSWLTYLSPSLANDLSPYNIGAGILGEASLMLWLLVMGVNVQLKVSRAASPNRVRRAWEL